MNNGVVIGTAVSGKAAYILVAFAAIGVFVTAKQTARVYQDIKQSVLNQQ